ncbi:MAG: hypothetical protein ACRDWA_16840 [Acidimicrobiia bacterium]
MAVVEVETTAVDVVADVDVDVVVGVAEVVVVVSAATGSPESSLDPSSPLRRPPTRW